MLKKMPDTIVLVFYMVLMAAALTWVVPSGEYVRETVEVDGRFKEVVVDDSFHYVERSPQLFSVFSPCSTALSTRRMSSCSS